MRQAAETDVLELVRARLLRPAPPGPAAEARAAWEELRRGWGEGPGGELASDLRAWLRELDLRRRPPLSPPRDPQAEAALVWARAGWHWLPPEAGGPAWLADDPELRLREALEAHLARTWLGPELLRAAEPTRRLERARRLEQAGRRVVAALARPDALRRALWLRPPLVLERRWVAALELLPRDLWPALLESAAQRQSWEALLGQPLPAEPALALAELERRPTLPVDEGLHPPPVAEAIRVALPASAARGLLLAGENAGALRLLLRRFRGQVQCAYLDPPFNTANDAWAYRDRFSPAEWLAFLDERLALTRELLCPDGTLYAHIDGHEKERLRLLLDQHLHHVGEIIWRIGWVSGFKSRANKFVRNHDTIYHYGRSPRPRFTKRYLPYPEGYRRRDGQAPRGQGYPLEDTWNCSPLDRLDSILIKSFSREKVGRGVLTQKNEHLLERMLFASSAPEEWVLDPFSGSGTTAAVAHKTGRRWLACEVGAEQLEVSRRRLERVILGDPYGISADVDWRGGGAFLLLRLESLPEAEAALLPPGTPAAAGAVGWRWDGGALRLEGDGLGGGAARLQGGGPVDLPATLALWLGLREERWRRSGDVLSVAGRDAQGRPLLLLWNQRPGGCPLAALEAAREASPSGRVLTNDPGQLATLRAACPGWEVGEVALAGAEACAAESAPAR